jgi:hypothetical protein
LSKIGFTLPDKIRSINYLGTVMKKIIEILCITAILFSGTALLAEEYNTGVEWLKTSEVDREL